MTVIHLPVLFAVAFGPKPLPPTPTCAVGWVLQTGKQMRESCDVTCARNKCPASPVSYYLYISSFELTHRSGLHTTYSHQQALPMIVDVAACLSSAHMSCVVSLYILNTLITTFPLISYYFCQSTVSHCVDYEQALGADATNSVISSKTGKVFLQCSKADPDTGIAPSFKSPNACYWGTSKCADQSFAVQRLCYCSCPDCPRNRNLQVGSFGI